MTEEKKQTKAENTKTGDNDTKRKNVFEEFGDSVGRFATRTFDTIKETIDKSLDSRNTVLTIRVNEEANKKLNMLVNAGIFKSRSESAAFLIEEGVKHQEELFKKIAEKLEKIERIKDELKDIISEEMSDKAEK
jgi:Arc/MetJ-type ribon-helix-helix transcriptional regulator